MKKRALFSCTAIAFALQLSPMNAAESIGIVNFAVCYQDSKLGKQESSNFENVRNQMMALLEDTEKQLKDITSKLNDKDHLDSLSPEGEMELQNKYAMLTQEMDRYQNQYYQILNQAQMRIIQTLTGYVNMAAEKVAEDKHLSFIFNKDLSFYYAPQYDVTNDVIIQMDKMYDQEQKKAPPASPSIQ